jgi:hypothetical protein
MAATSAPASGRTGSSCAACLESPDLKAQIADEIYTALQLLDADEQLLVIMGSWAPFDGQPHPIFLQVKQAEVQWELAPEPPRSDVS